MCLLITVNEARSNFASTIKSRYYSRMLNMPSAMSLSSPAPMVLHSHYKWSELTHLLTTLCRYWMNSVHAHTEEVISLRPSVYVTLKTIEHILMTYSAGILVKFLWECNFIQYRVTTYIGMQETNPTSDSSTKTKTVYQYRNANTVTEYYHLAGQGRNDQNKFGNGTCLNLTQRFPTFSRTREIFVLNESLAIM
jgi:hypothetical protein